MAAAKTGSQVEMTDALVTVGELRAAGLRLGMHCTGCARFRYLGMDRYEDDSIVSEIGKTLICRRCRARGLEVMAVERDPGSGFWPAEYA
jgi:hypothetical protein